MHDILELVEQWPELAGATVESRLSSGPLSDKWKLTGEYDCWVLRRDKPLARQLELNRTAEPEALAALAAEGWCPEPVRADARQGVLVLPFVPGRAWTDTDMQQPAQLERLAKLLCRLHRCAVQLPPFALERRVKRYAGYLGSASAAQCADNIHHLLAEAAASQTVAVCHNDPVAGNVIDDGELRLIDFEFCAAGDPLFDLAVVIEHHRLPAATVDLFVDAYRQAGGRCDMQLLEQWRMIYCQTVSLWNQIVAAV